MAEVLNSFNLNAQISSLLSGSAATFPLGVPTFSPSLGNLLAIALTDGAGANQANNLYCDQRTLTAGSNERINLYSFGGINDPVGVAYVNVRVKIIIIQNLNATDTNQLNLGNDATAAEFTSIFGAAGHIIKLNGNSTLIFANPGATGWAVANGTNNLLKILNTSGVSITYNIIVVGAKT